MALTPPPRGRGPLYSYASEMDDEALPCYTYQPDNVPCGGPDLHMAQQVPTGAQCVIIDHYPSMSTDWTIVQSGGQPREPDPLVQHSDYAGWVSGWYTVRPRGGWRVPYMTVNRMYGSDTHTSRELVHMSTWWAHPSREYALEIARQIAVQERFIYAFYPGGIPWRVTTAERVTVSCNGDAPSTRQENIAMVYATNIPLGVHDYE